MVTKLSGNKDKKSVTSASEKEQQLFDDRENKDKLKKIR